MRIKHIITGGPCTGKTTTVSALRDRGFRTIDEASRLLIEEQLKSGGDLVPWKDLHGFNVAVTDRQLEMEARVTDETHFLDRGVIDNLAYCEWGKIDPPGNLKDASKQTDYHTVFLLEPLPHMENDDVRKETPEDRALLHTLLKKHYEAHGYQVVEVPPWPVQERVEFILKKIRS